MTLKSILFPCLDLELQKNYQKLIDFDQRLKNDRFLFDRIIIIGIII